MDVERKIDKLAEMVVNLPGRAVEPIVDSGWRIVTRTRKLKGEDVEFQKVVTESNGPIFLPEFGIHPNFSGGRTIEREIVKKNHKTETPARRAKKL